MSLLSLYSAPMLAFSAVLVLLFSVSFVSSAAISQQAKLYEMDDPPASVTTTAPGTTTTAPADATTAAAADATTAAAADATAAAAADATAAAAADATAAVAADAATDAATDATTSAAVDATTAAAAVTTTSTSKTTAAAVTTTSTSKTTAATTTKPNTNDLYKEMVLGKGSHKLGSRISSDDGTIRISAVGCFTATFIISAPGTPVNDDLLSVDMMVADSFVSIQAISDKPYKALISTPSPAIAVLAFVTVDNGTWVVTAQALSDTEWSEPKSFNAGIVKRSDLRKELIIENMNSDDDCVTKSMQKIAPQ